MPPCVVSQQTSLYSVLPLKTKGIGRTLLKCMVPFYTSKHFQAEPGLSRGSCVYTRPSRYKSRSHWTQLRSRVEHCSRFIVCHLLSWKPSCGLRIAHVPLCVIYCRENPAVVWEYGRQMTRLEWWWHHTSDSGLVQITDDAFKTMVTSIFWFMSGPDDRWHI